MSKSLVMTVLGADRPGLVEKLASLVASHGGSWQESRMCRLGGQFAGILLADVPQDQEEAFRKNVEGLEGLVVSVYGAEPRAAAAGADALVIGILGQDRPGIVSQISEVLARRSVNVEDLHTERVSAPMTGEVLFSARINVAVPHGCDLDSLRRDLEKIASDLMVDLTFAPAENTGT